MGEEESNGVVTKRVGFGRAYTAATHLEKPAAVQFPVKSDDSPKGNQISGGSLKRAIQGSAG